MIFSFDDKGINTTDGCFNCWTNEVGYEGHKKMCAFGQRKGIETFQAFEVSLFVAKWC